MLKFMTICTSHKGRRLGVDVLDGRGTVISGVRFLGATLWTDFALGGTDPSAIDRAMAVLRGANCNGRRWRVIEITTYRR
jgi:hypothetical protein